MGKDGSVEDDGFKENRCGVNKYGTGVVEVLKEKGTVYTRWCW